MDISGSYRCANRDYCVYNRDGTRDKRWRQQRGTAVNSFFEWKNGGNRKVPYYIRLRNAPLFAFAGLCDTWKSPDGSVILSYTIITTRPNELVAQVHDRMPAILLPEYEMRWEAQAPLSPDDVARQLAPYPSGAMEMYRVSDRVNVPGNDTPDVIEPVG